MIPGVDRFNPEVLLFENGVLVAKVFVASNMRQFEGFRVFTGVFVAVSMCRTFQFNDRFIDGVQSVFGDISITLSSWIVNGILQLSILHLFFRDFIMPLTVQSPGQIVTDRVNRMITT